MIQAAAVDVLRDSEKGVIGVLLFRPSLEEELLGALDRECFDHPWTREAFTVATEAHARSLDITQGLFEVELSRRGLGGRDELRHFFDECREEGGLTVRTHREHVDSLQNRRDLRRLKLAVTRFDDVEDAEREIIEWLGRRTAARYVGPVPLGDVMRDVAERQHAIAAGTLAIGFTTGLDALDEHVQIRMGDLHGIIARTGECKSAFLLHLLSANESNPALPCESLLFSLEMAADAVGTRRLGYEARVNTRFVNSRFAGPDTRAKLDEAAERCANIRIEVDGSADLTVAEIIARATHWKRRRQLKQGIVAVDFAQLVRRERNRDENSAEAFQRVAYGLRGFAQSEGLAVIVTAQVNRVGALASTPPELEHVEGGGGLGRAVSVCLALHLPEKQQGTVTDVQRMEIYVRKNRHGQHGQMIPCTVDLSTGRFS